MSNASVPPEQRFIDVTFCALTDVGRVRSHNEDAFVAMDVERRSPYQDGGVVHQVRLGARGMLLAVSDGMGGAAAGEVASALVLQTLEDSLAHADAPDDAVLRDAVESANRAVFEAAKDPAKRGMGATLTSVLVHGRFAYIASVGDSRAYLLRGARFRQMTKDHSYVQVLMDAGVMDSVEAERSPMKHVVLQSMGQKADVQVALGRLALFRGDRLVLCSDGLTGHLKDAEISAILSRRDLPLDAIAKALVDGALERGGEDNVTVLVAEVTGSALERAEMPESVTQTFEVISEFQPSFGSRRASAPSEPAPSPAPVPVPASASPAPVPTPKVDSLPPPSRTPSVRPSGKPVSGRVITLGLLLVVFAVACILAVARILM